jgi:hypothetical protein
MTKDKFQSLCDRILVPRMGDLLHQHLSPVHETLEIMAAELVRIGRRLEQLASEQCPDDRRD